jgi:hypothetical protein
MEGGDSTATHYENPTETIVAKVSISNFSTPGNCKGFGMGQTQPRFLDHPEKQYGISILLIFWAYY